MPEPQPSDAIVIGGGLVGAAIGYGLARQGLKVTLLDEGDVALRAARGNFGLVWVQSKGPGVPEYQHWTRLSSDRWPGLAAELRETTGVDCAHERRGGFAICLTEDELEQRRQMLEVLRRQAGAVEFEYEILDHGALARRVPLIGPEVVGASYTPYDGAVHPLYLLRALHAGLLRHGARYEPNARVNAVHAAPHDFRIEARGTAHAAPRLVLAAGLGSRELAPLAGLHAPLRPVRGQILATERVAPAIPLTQKIRQMSEGALLIGDSFEEAGYDDSTAPQVLSALAARAVRTFPFLREVQLVRSWAALRVMSPDGLPIYEQSARFPGAFLASCHSGVTLAAAHAYPYAEAVARGALPDELARFASRRFDVPKAA
ncbi:MAG: FAD-binding oxidoreductase [Betaproteobacteria bacterium]|nr:FAD-binding oxidoreductase [Betaproteobacteria bacterium]